MKLEQLAEFLIKLRKLKVGTERPFNKNLIELEFDDYKTNVEIRFEIAPNGQIFKIPDLMEVYTFCEYYGAEVEYTGEFNFFIELEDSNNL